MRSRPQTRPSCLKPTKAFRAGGNTFLINCIESTRTKPKHHQAPHLWWLLYHFKWWGPTNGPWWFTLVSHCDLWFAPFRIKHGAQDSDIRNVAYQKTIAGAASRSMKAQPIHFVMHQCVHRLFHKCVHSGCYRTACSCFCHSSLTLLPYVMETYHIAGPGGLMRTPQLIHVSANCSELYNWADHATLATWCSPPKIIESNNENTSHSQDLFKDFAMP